MTTTRSTEFADPALHDLDLRTGAEIIALLLASQQRALAAVEAIQPALARAVEVSVERLSAGSGRLVYAGAGTSGRLAVQDGAELWATYGWPAERLQVSIAGGERALKESLEGVEDSTEAAATEVASLNIDERDVVLTVAASGRSPWTCRWCEAARARGALTVALANNAGSPLLSLAEFPLLLASGPEVLAGSTRMAAGTAQKIALNLFSSTLMVRLGRTHGNLLVDMAANNAKLSQRRCAMIRQIVPGTTDEQANEALRRADNDVKLAVLLRLGLDESSGRTRLQASGGRLRPCLVDLPQTATQNAER